MFKALSERMGYGSVRDAEGVQRIVISGKSPNPVRDPVGSDAGVREQLLGSLSLTCIRQLLRLQSLLLNPIVVTGYEGAKCLTYGLPVWDISECLHRELHSQNLRSGGAFHLGVGNPSRADQLALSVN